MQYGQTEVIADRYQVIKILDSQQVKTTYTAIDFQTSQPVVIKIFSLHLEQNWQILDLFAREAQVLLNLNHPLIARYLNYFQFENKQGKQFVLVREFIAGNSLYQLNNNFWHPSSAKIKEISIQLLDILSYLHSLTPAIVHRNLKPENIILHPNNDIYLVDLGTIEHVYTQAIDANYLINFDLNYAAPEQLYGRAEPRSDLYSLGLTILFLLTKISPLELTQSEDKIYFRNYVNLNDDFADWLEILLAPKIQDRFKSATIASKMLLEEQNRTFFYQSTIQNLGSNRILKRQTKNYLSIEIFYSFNDLIIDFGQNIESYTEEILPKILKSLPWFLTIIIIIFKLNSLLTYFALLISLLLFLFVFRNKFFIDRCYLKLDWQSLKINNSYLGKITRQEKINLIDINSIEIDHQKHFCLIRTNNKNYQFGFNLDTQELQSLSREIHDFLTQRYSRKS